MTDDDDVARANARRNSSHTLSLVGGKGCDWDVELIDGWLKSIDDDTYDQVVAAFADSGKRRTGVGTAAGGLDRGLAVQEHGGVATRVVGA